MGLSEVYEGLHLSALARSKHLNNNMSQVFQALPVIVLCICLSLPGSVHAFKNIKLTGSSVLFGPSQKYALADWL